MEGPAAIFGGSAATAPAGTGGAFASGGTLVNGLLVNFNNPGQAFLTGVTPTTDRAPDVIEKMAFDPGWGPTSCSACSASSPITSLLASVDRVF